MNNTPLRQKENYFSKPLLKPIFWKIITWVSLVTSLIISDWINNPALSDINIKAFNFESLRSKNTKEVAIKWIESCKIIKKLIQSNDIFNIKIELESMEFDMDKFKNEEYLQGIKKDLKELSEGLDSWKLSTWIIDALKDKYIILWNRKTNKSEK